MSHVTQRRKVGLDLDNSFFNEVDPFISEINREFNLSLTRKDYSENHPAMYGATEEEARRMTRWWHASGAIAELKPLAGAVEVLGTLHDEGWDFVPITSRQSEFRRFTTHSLLKHAQGIINPDDAFFTEFYGANRVQQVGSSKAPIYRKLGCVAAIDDFVKHCEGAANPVLPDGRLAYAPLPAFLMGDEPWNQAGELSSGILRCNDWQQLGASFHAHVAAALRAA